MAPDCSLNITGLAITTAQGFCVTYCITFMFLLLCLVPFWVQQVIGCDNFHKLHCFNIFTGVFVKLFCIWNIITELYQVACQCGHFPAPMPKLKRDKHELNQRPIQSAPLLDEYTTGIQTRLTLVLDDNSPLLTPLMTEEYTLKAVFQPTKQLKSAEDITSEGHLPGDIIDILERLGKADNIPFNQLYYIAENCADFYYSKVIETFISILKCRFANHQLLLVNTTQSLKFLEEYTDRQAQIWKIFQKHQTIPEDFQDLHLHFDDFNSIEKDFAFLKAVTSLNLQQTYSTSLCSHVNNIYNKLAELQWQIQHHDPHMNSGDTIQIEAPDFDLDIDDISPTTIDQEPNNLLIQGTASLTPKLQNWRLSV